MEEASSLYNFNLDCFHALFPRNEYGTKMVTIDDVEQMNLHQDKNLNIVVSDYTPTRGNECFNRNIFDLHVVCILQAEEKGRSPHYYNAIRYMRHPGYDCFWKQEKDDHIVTKCITGDDFWFDLQNTNIPNFYSCVSVYARRGCDQLDPKWYEVFFKSIGGKIMFDVSVEVSHFCLQINL